MKVYELAEYLIGLEPEEEVRLLENLEPNQDGLIETIDLTPSIMFNKLTGERVLALIKSDQLEKAVKNGIIIPQTFKDQLS
jgi:hypothetical protein